MIGKGKVQEGKEQWEEENSQDLFINGLLDLLLIETDLLQNDKAFTVFIAFRDLFVVDDENCSHHKDDGEEDTDKEGPTKESTHLRTTISQIASVNKASFFA